jgi:PilZ domain
LNIKEHRRFPGFVCDTGVPIHPEKGHTGYWGTVGNISLGGCYVFTFSPLPAGQVVTLAIKANDKEINLGGKDGEFASQVGMGIAFNGYTQEDGEERLKGLFSTWPASRRRNQWLCFIEVRTKPAPSIRIY